MSEVMEDGSTRAIAEFMGDKDAPEVLANATAIAAMPDIVAAAKLALDALLPHFDDDEDGSDEAEASNALLAALKKGGF